MFAILLNGAEIGNGFPDQAAAIKEAVKRGVAKLSGGAVSMLPGYSIGQQRAPLIRAAPTQAPRASSHEGEVEEESKRGQAWTKEEEKRLGAGFAANKPIAVLAEEHGRTKGAIRSRLVKAGFTTWEGLAQYKPKRPGSAPTGSSNNPPPVARLPDHVLDANAAQLLPQVNRLDASKQFGHIPVAWDNFARACIEQEFVEQSLRRRQGGVCPICQEPIGKYWQIHHVDYLRRCWHSGVADCKSCSIDAAVEFEQCLIRLRLLHERCHMRVHHIDRQDPVRVEREKTWAIRKVARTVIRASEWGEIATRTDALQILEEEGWKLVRCSPQDVVLKDPVSKVEITLYGWPFSSRRAPAERK